MNTGKFIKAYKWRIKDYESIFTYASFDLCELALELFLKYQRQLAFNDSLNESSRDANEFDFDGAEIHEVYTHRNSLKHQI